MERNWLGKPKERGEKKKRKKKKKKVGYRAPAALPVPFQFLQANTCPLYLTLTGFDQNQELVHFGKLTPPQNGRIPEMQNAGVFAHFHVARRQDQGEKIWLWDLHWPSLPYMDFDQNQKIGHFGKVTPPQRGRIPEIPIAVCFGAENPLIFRRKIASKSRNFPNFPENDPCL